MTRNEAEVSRLDRRAFGRLAGAGVLGAWAAEVEAVAVAAPVLPATPPQGGRQAFAYTFGYIKALIRAVDG
jgi:hypothetical protein